MEVLVLVLIEILKDIGVVSLVIGLFFGYKLSSWLGNKAADRQISGNFVDDLKKIMKMFYNDSLTFACDIENRLNSCTFGSYSGNYKNNSISITDDIIRREANKGQRVNGSKLYRYGCEWASISFHPIFVLLRKHIDYPFTQIFNKKEFKILRRSFMNVTDFMYSEIIFNEGRHMIAYDLFADAIIRDVENFLFLKSETTLFSKIKSWWLLRQIKKKYTSENMENIFNERIKMLNIVKRLPGEMRNMTVSAFNETYQVITAFGVHPNFLNEENYNKEECSRKNAGMNWETYYFTERLDDCFLTDKNKRDEFYLYMMFPSSSMIATNDCWSIHVSRLTTGEDAIIFRFFNLDDRNQVLRLKNTIKENSSKEKLYNTDNGIVTFLRF